MCPVRRVTALQAMGLGMGLLVACTDYKPASDTLDSVSSPLDPQDSEVLDDFGADWSCLGGEPAAPLPLPGALGASIVYSIRLVDLATGNAMPQVTVQACGLTDITCAAPVTDVIDTDDEGYANVPLTANFRGYLEVRSPVAVPYLIPLPEGGLRTMRDFPMSMISLESFGALVGALRINPDPTLGAIGFRAFDCQGQTAGGVVLKTTTGGVPWYFENGLPNTERGLTDQQGLGGFIGTTTGVTVLEGELSDGTPTATKSIIVRAGWMTAGYLRPANAVIQ